MLGDRYIPGGIHAVLHICQSIFAPKMMWWCYCYLSGMSKVVKKIYFFANNFPKWQNPLNIFFNSRFTK